MLVIKLCLDLRRVCLDHESVIKLNLEGQAELIRDHLNLWFEYEDVKFVFRAKSGAEYSAVVLKAANGGEAHKKARSIDKFLQQPLTPVDGKGGDLTVCGILGITATTNQLIQARARLADKYLTALRKLSKQRQGIELRKSSGDKRVAAAATAEALEVDGEIAQREQHRQALLEGRPDHNAEDDELVFQLQVCILTFAS